MRTRTRNFTHRAGTHKKSHTIRSHSSSSLSQFHKKIATIFIQILNTVKLYHWKTHSYATHKATDELYDKLNDSIDSFIEVLLGKTGSRINFDKHTTIPLKIITTKEQMDREISSLKKELVDLNNTPALKSMSNTDLFNIRDDILGHLNQFLYLATFK